MHYLRYFAIAFLLLLSSCSVTRHKPLIEGSTTTIPNTPSSNFINGSIFQQDNSLYYGYQPLFEDRRPKNIGDILTVLLQENVSASKSSSSNASRKSNANLEMNALPKIINKIIGNDQLSTDINSNNGFNGKGGSSAANTFSGTITVTVIDILTNGNLKVIGEKKISINQGTESIRFYGIVNPKTIDHNNQVMSNLISDSKIEYIGDGYINEVQKMNWLQRLFLNYFPF
ncbi:flgH [Wigglesworthia glossinidia endosymbiont of Glossina brevipalpis]|uniref:Flagellar L-ring protein n=1 Tax=Wigglesworthia glossinidia brevipalpis TaxID=36870 RepID=FLGH_WIGBR|nr:RecName: Full=Flagellar L-ring protein; AltName: Full=Basal body L-ring protein; Flags: Precursor [Wigglesworthia glossinidia endosymbiont of Glossina brevipalpis]BAC24190.1 flgH [Wigglesworthia glossinidia endosymbiont of Glossina brevipalpis]